MAPSSAAQWFGAAATLLAVIVALFKDSIREWRRKPKLIVTCENSPPCTVRTPLFVNDLRTSTEVRSFPADVPRSRVSPAQNGALG